MSRLLVTVLLVTASGIGAQTPAHADVPDPTLSVAVTAANEDVLIFLCPGCDGPSLDNTSIFGGEEGHDATITVTLYDSQFTPVANFPREDIWFTANGLCYCSGPSIADQNTNFNGQTTFSEPPCAGGYSQDFSVVVHVDGNPLAHPPLPHLQFNSADINCDFVVNLSDIVHFAGAYFGAYEFNSDYYWDAVVNLSDVVILVQHLSHSCP